MGDGEAPLATSWHSNKFLDARRDGAVLPILHLNGYKIANPTVLARIPHAKLKNLFVGYGYKPYFVVNIIVACKQPAQQWLAMNAAIEHARAGIGKWNWAWSEGSGEPDVVLAVAGDVQATPSSNACATGSTPMPATSLNTAMTCLRYVTGSGGSVTISPHAQKRIIASQGQPVLSRWNATRLEFQPDRSDAASG